MQIKIDQIIHTRRKSIAIIVEGDGRLVIRAPMRLSKARIQEFVLTKTDWILAQQAKAASRQASYSCFQARGNLPVFGKNNSTRNYR